MKSTRSSVQTFLTILFIIVLVISSYYHEYIANFFTIPEQITATILGFLALIPIGLVIRSNSENEKLKNEFVTIVTHKFRTPITAIKWSTEILKSEVTYEEKQVLLKRLTQASEKLSEIVDLLVRYVKYDKGLEYIYKATSFREMVFESIKRFAETMREKNIELDIDPMTSLPLIVLDEAKIQFAIDTIIENAFKYTPPSGKIKISTSQNEKSITLHVLDSGIGISPKDLKRVTVKFFRTTEARKMDTEGLGLGLYTAKKIVSDHGGKLKIESKGAQKGTLVTLEIPKH